MPCKTYLVKQAGQPAMWAVNAQSACAAIIHVLGIWECWHGPNAKPPALTVLPTRHA